MSLANLTAWSSPPPPVARHAEDDLIRTLSSPDWHKVDDALDQLHDRYSNSPNATPAIRKLLFNKRVQRKAAHILGEQRATLELDEVKVILGFLRAYDVNEVMDALKILRALQEPDAIVRKIVADILPLLKDPETHVVRDACRTLAVLGNKDTVPFIEPLSKDKRSDVQKDAQDAIARLEKGT